MRKISYFIFLALAMPLMLSAQWSLSPTINTPVCLSNGEQKDLRMTADGKGGVFIAWKDLRATNGKPDIYVQRLDSLGIPLWTVNGSDVCTQAADQSTPAIVSDDKDGVIIAWSDWRSNIERDIYAQRMDRNGNKLWPTDGAPVTIKNAREHSEKIIPDGLSGVIVVWEQQRSNGTWDIWTQRIDSSGNEVWPSGGKPLCTNSANRRNHKVQGDGKGGAIVVWQDERGNDFNIYGQHIDANGNLLWSDTAKAICIAPGTQNNPKIDPEKNNNGVYISWVDSRNGNDYDVYAQRLDSAGNLLWGPVGLPVVTAVGNQSAIDILSNNKIDGLIVTWKDERSGNFDIYAQRLNATGAPQWGTNGMVVCNANGEQLNPNIVSDNDTGAIVVWQDHRNTDWDIFAQRIDKNGQTVWSANGEAVCTAPGDQTSPKNVPDSKGGSIFAWQDERTSGADDIYAHHLFASGSPNTVRNVIQSIEKMSISPNPCSNQLVLDVHLSHAEILYFTLQDMQGRVIQVFDAESQLYSKGNHQIRFSMSQNALRTGIYLLRIQTSNGTIGLKVIKE